MELKKKEVYGLLEESYLANDLTKLAKIEKRNVGDCYDTLFENYLSVYIKNNLSSTTLTSSELIQKFAESNDLSILGCKYLHSKIKEHLQNLDIPAKNQLEELVTINYKNDINFLNKQLKDIEAYAEEGKASVDEFLKILKLKQTYLNAASVHLKDSEKKVVTNNMFNAPVLSKINNNTAAVDPSVNLMNLLGVKADSED